MFFFKLGGTRPHAPPRQNVAASICQVDSQIVAWPAVKGHRCRHTHRLRKNNRCDTKANINFQQKMFYSVIVNLTNGGINGITIRLHGFGHRRLDKGTARDSSKFLLDYDVNRHGKSDEGKSGRDYFPDHVSSDVGSWSLEKKIFFDGGQRFSPLDERLQLQCWTGSALQIYQKMGEGWRKMADRKTGEERRSSQKGFRCQINLCSWFEKRSRKLLLSTIGRIVLLRPSKKSTRWYAAVIAGPSTRWKKLNWEGHSSISLSSTVNMLLIAGKILENQNRFPPTTWARNCPGFLIYIKYKRNKEQAQAT